MAVFIAAATFTLVLAQKRSGDLAKSAKAQAELKLQRKTVRDAMPIKDRLSFAEHVEDDLSGLMGIPIYEPTRNGSDQRPFRQPELDRQFRRVQELTGRGPSSFVNARAFPEPPPSMKAQATAQGIMSLAEDSNNGQLPEWKFRIKRYRDE